jgi:hypothetical protein
MTKKPIFKNVDCVSLKVDDLDKAIDFYTNKLIEPCRICRHVNQMITLHA